MILSSLEFTTPNWFWLLPLPILIYWFIPAYRTKHTAIKVPFFSLLTKALNEELSQGATQLKASWWQRLILIITWICVVIALAQPTILGKPQTKESIGRDIMIAVDLSGSMAEQDFTTPDGEKTNRLEAAKLVLNDFVKQRKGDRLGLILFGDAAYVQTPFTADHHVWSDLLNQTDVAMAGESTALGDAIGLSIKVFEQTSTDKDRQKVVIMLTDGNDTGSFVEPLDAAKVAAAKGVRIHVIAMGDPKTVGEQAMDMDVINEITKTTKGSTFQAKDTKALQKAYADINKLEPQLYDSTTYRPKISLHHYFIAIVMLLYLIAFTIVTLKRIYLNRKQKNDLNTSANETATDKEVASNV